MLGVRYYTARCGVWVKCCYELKTDGIVNSDGGYVVSCPSPINNHIDIYKWQDCGTVCCMKEFSICKDSIMLYLTRIINQNSFQDNKILSQQ